MLSYVVDQTFNCLSIDGDESTSDTVVCIASNQVADGEDVVTNEVFEPALLQVCQGLASGIVRNGEGTSHVMLVSITNFPGTKSYCQ
jgi:glutamate N-acetyltransferase / amino-acid N-acetyltransferase